MHIGELEELVLLAIKSLGDDAYGVPVREALGQAGRNVSVGTLYVTVERLEKKGLIESRMGEVTSERGGRAKKYLRLTGAGQNSWSAADSARRQLSNFKQLARGAA